MKMQSRHALILTLWDPQQNTQSCNVHTVVIHAEPWAKKRVLFYIANFVQFVTEQQKTNSIEMYYLKKINLFYNLKYRAI